jgi:hypothetical protein
MAKDRKAPPSLDEMRAAAARVEAHAEAAEAWEVAMRQTFGNHLDLEAVEWRSHPGGMFRTPILSGAQWEKAAEADQGRYRGPGAPTPRPAPLAEPFNPEEERLQPMSTSPL